MFELFNRVVQYIYILILKHAVKSQKLRYFKLESFQIAPADKRQFTEAECTRASR
jgi:hypothetical protein